MVQFDVFDSKSLIVMTIIHMNAILGEPGAAKNSFSGSSPTRLSDPDNEVGAGTVFPRINAAAFIKFFMIWVRRLFEGGVYSRAAFI